MALTLKYEKLAITHKLYIDISLLHYKNQQYKHLQKIIDYIVMALAIIVLMY